MKMLIIHTGYASDCVLSAKYLYVYYLSYDNTVTIYTSSLSCLIHNTRDRQPKLYITQQVLYFLLSTLVLTLYIDVVLSLSIRRHLCTGWVLIWRVHLLHSSSGSFTPLQCEIMMNTFSWMTTLTASQWSHVKVIAFHLHLVCFLKMLSMLTNNKTSKLNITGPFWGESISRSHVVILTNGQWRGKPFPVNEFRIWEQLDRYLPEVCFQASLCALSKIIFKANKCEVTLCWWSYSVQK